MFREKVAVTLFAELTETVQSAVPEQALPHPPNVDVASGVATSVTVDPGVKLLLQVAPQLIPAGVLVTAPAPVPLFVTETAKVMNSALTVLA